MNTTYPLDPILDEISSKKNISRNDVTCDDVKTFLLSSTREDGNRMYNINFKEDEVNDLILFYYNEQHEMLSNNSCATAVTTNDVENACKSCVYERSSLKYLCSQFNRIIYNEEAFKLLLPNDLSNTIVQKCYEGTTLLVFNHKNKWFISTRKCIDAGESVWVKNQSFKDLFEETMNNNNTSDNNSTENLFAPSIYNLLNPDYVYVFILVHYKNKNIVNYNQPFKFNNRHYKQLYLSNVSLKGTYVEICRDAYNLTNVPWTEEYKLESVDELRTFLEQYNEYDTAIKSISTEGFVLKIYKDSNKTGKFTIAKLQTNIYRYIMSNKPNVQNVYQIYLEFYKRDVLTDLLPYFYKGKNNIIIKIHNSMKILTKEMLELYHKTRNKRNETLYGLMPKIYRKVLYDLHGIYIKNKKDLIDSGSIGTEIETKIETNIDQELNTDNADDNMSMLKSNKSINIHDVYNFLKELPLKQLIKIFQEREQLIEGGKVECLNSRDMDIAIYTKYLLD